VSSSDIRQLNVATGESEKLRAAVSIMADRGVINGQEFTRSAVNDPARKRIILEKQLNGFRIAQSFLGALATRDFSFRLCRVMHKYSSTIA
jgi:hypothetical protein